MLIIVRLALSLSLANSSVLRHLDVFAISRKCEVIRNRNLLAHSLCRSVPVCGEI